MKNINLFIILLIFSTSLWSQSDSAGVYDPDIGQLIAKISRDSIKLHIENLADAGEYQSRVSYTAGNEWSANYIHNTLTRYMSNDAVRFDTFYVSGASEPYKSLPLVNVIATLEGDFDSTMYYVVGGHFDATADRDTALIWDNDWMTARAPGADDNATGVAAILEIARVLADPANNYLPPVTIKFVTFGAEERHPVYGDGHKGSGNFVYKAFLNTENIAGAYILDMFGFNDTGNDYYNIVSNTKSIEMARTMVSANETYQIGLTSNSEPFPYATYSDHDRFWAYGYRAILLIENAPPWEDNLPRYNLNPYYHYESDTPEKVNYAQVFKITQLTLASLVTIGNEVTQIQSHTQVSANIDEFELLRNYPNPFNATTTIEYTVNKTSKVVMEVFNIKGQKVSELVNRSLPPGQYAQQWMAMGEDGLTLSTGIYFVTLRINDQSSSRKIMLMK